MARASAEQRLTVTVDNANQNNKTSNNHNNERAANNDEHKCNSNGNNNHSNNTNNNDNMSTVMFKVLDTSTILDLRKARGKL